MENYCKGCSEALHKSVERNIISNNESSFMYCHGCGAVIIVDSEGRRVYNEKGKN